MQKNKTKDMIVVGFALFAIFFGAGNLIFPPYLGAYSGNEWLASTLGFLITDPIFPIIGVIATAMVGGMADDLGKRVSPKFSLVISTISILTIGPFLAIPRTAATTHEIFTAQVFGDGTRESISPAVTSVVFFAVTLILVINPTKVIDYIGKFLTPILITIIAVAIAVAIFNPPGNIVAPIAPEGTNFFMNGFSEGYQTIDALGAAMMSGIVVTDLINKGYKEKDEQFKVIIGVGLVAGVLLAIVYGGLIYVGATVGDYFGNEVVANDKVTILVGMFTKLFGSFGKIIIGVAVAVACLTTSVGLTGIVGNFFTRVLKKEDSKNFYKIMVCVCVGISFFLSLFGVQKLVFYSVPVLLAIYPVYMILFLLTLFDTKIKYNWTYTGAVIAVILMSVPQGLAAFFGMNQIEMPAALGRLMSFYGELPLAKYGFEWLLPAICGSIILTVLSAALKIGKTRENA